MDGIVITLAGGRSVRGIVRGAAPRDPKERHVSLYHMARPGVFLGSHVDEQGAYAISGVPPGSVQVTLSAAAGQQLSKTAVVPADKDLTLDFDLPAGFRLSGRLSHRGKPVVGKMVWAKSLEQDKSRHYEATTSAQGTYEIEGIVAGDYAVAAEGVAERRFEIRSDTAFDIEVPSTQLGGRVLEEGSAIPIVGAGIQVTRMQAATSDVQIQTETDHFGRFAATGLDAGEILLSAYKPGYEMYRERLNYSSPVTNMTIRLRPSSGVELRAQVADRSRRHLYLIEWMETGRYGIQLRIALDENGVGSLPSALAGSTFEIYGGGSAPIVIREWDAQPLELKF